MLANRFLNNFNHNAFNGRPIGGGDAFAHLLRDKPRNEGFHRSRLGGIVGGHIAKARRTRGQFPRPKGQIKSLPKIIPSIKE